MRIFFFYFQNATSSEENKQVKNKVKKDKSKDTKIKNIN